MTKKATTTIRDGRQRAAAALLEQCLDDLADARDSNGLGVLLHRGDPTVEALRDSLFDLLGSVDRDTRFITSGVESEAAHAVFWDNVALLARATAAAIRYEEAAS